MELKRCKVVMLPTNTPSNILVMGHGKIGYDPSICKHYDGQHLYIVPTDEEIKKNPSLFEIKEGDWYLHNQSPQGLRVQQCINSNLPMDAKKIIATTDDLIIDVILNEHPTQDSRRNIYLPSPSEAFIMKYCEKGGTVDEVDVEYETTQRVSLAGKTKGGRVNTIKITNVVTSPKVDSHNTITIHPIKDSWTREEVGDLIYDAMKSRAYTSTDDWKKWIKENL